MPRRSLGYERINVLLPPKVVAGFRALAAKRQTTCSNLMRDILQRGLLEELMKEQSR